LPAALQTISETLGHSVQPTGCHAPSPCRRARGPHRLCRGRRGEPLVPERNNRLFDADYLLAARQALEQMPALAGHRLTVFHSIHFYDDGRINLDLVDPQQPGHVDSYHFERGQWRKGDPEPAAVRADHQPAAQQHPWPTSISRPCRAWRRRCRHSATRWAPR
jgi:hypothetical protein